MYFQSQFRLCATAAAMSSRWQITLLPTMQRNVGKDVKRISTPALNMLMSYHWPGNVRELENVIERATILSEGGVIHGYDLPPSLQTPVLSGTVAEGRTSTPGWAQSNTR
jgi:DNA-binding NtrC family response regulator